MSTAQFDLEKATHGAQRFREILLKNPDPAVGLTPKELIWSRNKAQLFHYYPQTERKYRLPVLLVYALINRPYVLDLYPGRSLVEGLLQQGYDVYLLDWGVAGPEDRTMKFEDYVMDYMPAAVRKVLRTAGTDQFSLAGYCMGGTLTALYAALYPDGPLRNLILLATPLDFADAGLYTSWLASGHLDVDLMVDTYGNIPPEVIDFGNKLLKPVTNWVRSYQGLAERAWDNTFVSHWLRINKWVNDGTPFPGEAFRQWIKEFYQQNKLVKGELVMGGRRVDLGQIRASVLNVVPMDDHIVQPCQSLNALDLMGSEDKERYTIKAGHVGMVTGPQGPKVIYPKLSEWLASRSL
jgi:polyhydroxyalkanoate synthase subunit PhaC